MSRDKTFRDAYANEWAPKLGAWVPGWNSFDDDDRKYLIDNAVWLASTKHWEATHGFKLTDEMIGHISAQGALLTLGLPDDCFGQLRGFIVAPKTMTLSGEQVVDGGFRSRDPQLVLGHVNAIDQLVFVSWADVDSLVVIHELAHVLDYVDGITDGTPPMPSAADRAEWVSVCTKYFDQIQTGAGPRCISGYAGTNTTEFFATVSETFFGRPQQLKEQAPDLYAVFSNYYGQDPAS